MCLKTYPGHVLRGCGRPAGCHFGHGKAQGKGLPWAYGRGGGEGTPRKLWPDRQYFSSITTGAIVPVGMVNVPDGPVILNWIVYVPALAVFVASK
jgi:hypothetical protein